MQVWLDVSCIIQAARVEGVEMSNEWSRRYASVHREETTIDIEPHTSVIATVLLGIPGTSALRK